MKRCPYCAEEIRDEAIKCRWCGSDLTVTPDEVVAHPPSQLLEKFQDREPGQVEAASGPIAGPTADVGEAPPPREEREEPEEAAEQPAGAEQPAPVQRTRVIPMPDFGQRAPQAAPAGGEAPAASGAAAPGGTPGYGAGAGGAAGAPGTPYGQPGAQPVSPPYGQPAGGQQASPPYGQPAGGQQASPAYGQPAAAQPPGGQVAPPPVQQPPQIIPARTASPSPSLTFSHEGPRYILGYSSDYFGLWDKAAPGPPAQKFPRTEQGWQQAWEALVRAEMAAGGR